MFRPILCILFLCLSGLLASLAPSRAEENRVPRKNVLIIGASSLASPLHEWLGAMLESNQTPMNVEPGFFGARTVEAMLRSKSDWDYVIMDAWQFKRGSTNAPEFPEAVTAFVKEVRAYSPQSQIILFPWWIPSGRDATNEGVMNVFRHCVQAARPNAVWVSTTGPAFMEARLARPDLRVTVSSQDAHPGVHGVYINACSLFAILTGASPVGLPATLKSSLRNREVIIAPDDAKYLQELAWKIYQREREHTKPVKEVRSRESP